MTLRDQIPIVGSAEIADMLGVSRQRADAITRKPSFPRPLGVISAGRVWLEEDVVAWAEAHGREVRD